MKYLLLITGGAAGTLLRYLLVNYFQSNNANVFPWGTFIVNISGALIIGLIAGMTLMNPLQEPIRLFIFVGLLGGFTTFSSLALETITLCNSGYIAVAVVYVLSTNIIGFLFSAAGYLTGIKIFPL